MLDYNYDIFKLLGHAMRANLPVELVTQGAFHKQDLATNWMIVLMGVMRLQQSVVNIILLLMQ